MACRKPIDKNRGLKRKREGEFRLGAVGLQAKRKTCLVVLPKQSHNTPVQVTAEGKRVCWYAFEPFIPPALLCMNKLCKKSASGGIKRRQSWWQVRQPALCWLLELSASAFLAFGPQRALFSYSPCMRRDLKSLWLHFTASECKTNSKIFIFLLGLRGTRDAKRFQGAGCVACTLKI